MVRLFNTLYKLGVEDAIAINDIYECEQWVKEHYAPMTFSRIVWGYDVSWLEWRFELTKLVTHDNFRKLGVRLLDCIGNYGTYFSAVFPIAMDFYIQGIKDYCARHDDRDFAKFIPFTFRKWGKKGLEKISIDDIVRDMQGYCFARARLDELKDEKGKQVAKDEQGRVRLTKRAYEQFALEIWRYTRNSSNKW
jgi:hypothetical protein